MTAILSINQTSNFDETTFITAAENQQGEQNEISGLPTIEFSDFVIDRCIGEGSFSHVFKVKIHKGAETLISRMVETGAIQVDDDENASFALKHARIKGLFPNEAEKSGEDFRNEASILASLNHKNIVQIKAASISACPEMILLELLETTLEDRLRYWRKEKRVQRQGSLRSVVMSASMTKKQTRLTSLQTRTESLVTGIAEGMAYLHSKNIILRDLKPENIGFDATGQVKLFDFGLACPVTDLRKYNVAGSLRYMSPECLLQAAGQLGHLESEEMTQCGLASDVHSFGVVLYEIATLEKPFATLLGRCKSPKRSRDNKGRGDLNFDDAASILLEKAAKQGWRPSTHRIPSKPLRNLIEECWSHFQGGRPSFDNIVARLPSIYCAMTPEEQDGADNSASSSSPIPLPQLSIGRLRRSVSIGGCDSSSSSPKPKSKRWQDRLRRARRTVSSAGEDSTTSKTAAPSVHSEHSTALTIPCDQRDTFSSSFDGDRRETRSLDEGDFFDTDSEASC